MKSIMILCVMMLSFNIVVIGQESSVVSPVPIEKIKNINEFGLKTHPVTHKNIFSIHMDFAVPLGTKVFSVADGKVIFTGYKGAWGLVVYIQVNDSTIVKYGQLSKVLVEKNQQIKKGQVVALSGCSGKCTGDVLTMRVEVKGKTINPRSIYNLPKIKHN